MRDPVHGGAHYQRLAKLVTDTAKREPNTRCCRCNNTIDQCKPHRNGRRAFWTAGHKTPRQHVSTLRLCDLEAECSTCNFSHDNNVIEQHTERW